MTKNTQFWPILLVIAVVGFWFGRNGNNNLYYWKRMINGDEIGDSKIKINDDYFIFSREDDVYFVFHRDYFDMPISINLKGKVTYEELERMGYVFLKNISDYCFIYSRSSDKSDIYVDYRLYTEVTVVATSEVIDDIRMLVMCSAFH